MLINSPNISGSLTVTGNATITGSLTVAGGINAAITGSATTASYVEYSNVANKPALVSGSSQVTYSGLTGVPSGIVSSSTQIGGYGIFAITGSNQFNGSQVITGSLTVTGQVVAQTLNVQQVTSSIVYSSGSNIFGNSLGNTQQFTGSVSVTGSLTVAGAGTFVSSITAGSDISLQSNESYLNLFSTYSVGLNSRARIRAVGAGGGSGYGGDFRVSTRKTDNNWNTDAFIVDSSGNVGIGTTIPTAYTGYTTLHIGSASSRGLLKLGNAASLDGPEITTTTSSDIYFNTNGTSTRMVISGTNGNIGIGTTSPSSKLSVDGDIRLQSSTAAAKSLIFSSPASNWGPQDSSIKFTPADGVDAATTLSFNLWDGLGAINERMRITSGGQVLIGQTVASGNTNGMYFRPGIESGFIVTSDVALQLSRLSTTGDIQTFYYGSTRVGKIAVGSSTVTFESNASGGLSIASTGAATFSSSVASGGWISVPNNFGLEARNAANTAGRVVIKLNTSNQIEIGRDTDISAIILGTTTEHMRITSGGYVGIGTTDPSNHKLYVQGNLSMSGSGLMRTYTAQSTTLGAQFDIFRFLNDAGSLIAQSGISGILFINAQDTATGGNQISYTFHLQTNGNGTSQANLTQMSFQLRGTQPITSIALANDGGSGGVKVVANVVGSGVSGCRVWATFVGVGV
jgi:hypothetical protein